MKTKLVITATLMLGSATTGAADYTDSAQVVSSSPVIERIVEPREECFHVTTSTAPQSQDRSLVGPIVGGIAGGVLGAQVGKGSGRTAATAAGAVAGAVMGDRIDNRQGVPTQPAQQCRTVETTREIVKGYNVVYRYNGRNISTTLPYDPGRTVRVGISAIDANQAGGEPAANVTGGNVREVYTTAPPPPPRSAPGGDYTYRY
jgi:uncharacterized protein YcfJ